jgi:hypothetical protein
MTQRTRTIILQGSGQTVEFAMPNLYQLVASHAKHLNPMTARIIELLEGYGPQPSASKEQRDAYARDSLMGAMELASLCLVSPRLVLDREPGEGEVDPSAFAYSDWGELMRLFRGDPPRPLPDADDSVARPIAAPVPDGEGFGL